MNTKNASVAVFRIICLFIMLGLLAAVPGCRERERQDDGAKAEKGRAPRSPRTGQSGSSPKFADEDLDVGRQRREGASGREDGSGEAVEDQKQKEASRPALIRIYEKLKRLRQARNRKPECKEPPKRRTENLARFHSENSA